MEQKACVKAEKLSNIIVDLQQIRKEVGVEQVDKHLENIFQNELFMEALKRRAGMTSLQEIIVAGNEICIFSNGLEKVNEQLGQSHFNYYAIDALSVLKN